MARSDRDREDLLAEATALIERIEMRLPGEADPLLVGFRRDGAASFYFGQDVAYQFNSQFALRRAHDHGRLYKSEKGRLISLDRQRRPGAVDLVAQDLSTEATAEFLAHVSDRLQRLAAALAAGQFQATGQVPAGVDVVARIRAWLSELPRPIPLAAAPGVR